METVRLTVSIPRKEFKRIEEEKKKKGLTRSALVQEIIKFFFTREEEEKKIKRYIEGYKKIPEDTSYIKSLESVQAEIFNREF